LKYRPEIDGLRALAVVPVILFHAGYVLFSGGFVGVDVFFVISGYLITTILIEDMDNNRFSFLSFYERRARRILPALFFVMLVCIPFAWMWMLPIQLEDFSQSLLAVSIFASNILFWRESGYFDAIAEEKPLLHTWSLAVEEQYYVLFPIFLFLAWRFGKDRVFWLIVIFTAISLALSEFGWRNHPIANFYLAPARAWELLAGSIAAFVVHKRGVQSNNTLSLFGLAAIVFSIFAYDETIPFPSVYALVPVCGVMLLLLFADKETFAARLLSTKGFVGIGLISYSAYLWHQPLFAFSRLALIESPSLTLMGLLSVMSLLLAVLSWRFVEKPFRNDSISRKSIFLFSIMGIIFFSMASQFIQSSKELSTKDLEILDWSKFNQTVEFKKSWEVGRCYIENSTSKWTDYDHDYCENISSSGINLVVLGDSHSAQLISALRKLEGVNVTNFASGGCRPFLVSPPKANSECVGRNDYFFKTFLPTYKTEIDVLILASRWQKNELNELESLINMSVSNNIHTILVGSSPFLSTPAPELVVRNRRTSTVGLIPKSFFDFRLVATDESLKNILPININFASVEDFVCNPDCHLINGSDLLMFDAEHLTPKGAELFVNSVLINLLATDGTF
jgi:peptidoglycan/LPS O-acetylase OafA/YrhL